MSKHKDLEISNKVFIIYGCYKESIFEEQSEWEIVDIFVHEKHLNDYLEKYGISIDTKVESGWLYKMEEFDLYKSVYVDTNS